MKRSCEELPYRLPVAIHEYQLPSKEQPCQRCGHTLEKIGRGYVRKEYECIPVQVMLHEYYHATCACGCRVYVRRKFLEACPAAICSEKR